MRTRPKLGQHYLTDEHVLAKIASASARQGDTVLEIGPGRGALTRHLLGIARHVVAVEIDPHLAESLPARCANAQHLTVIQADFLQLDLGRVLKETIPDQTVAAGNLPYYITSPILRGIFQARGLLRSATFLMQAEVADRVAAGPGSRSFGFLSCLCQLHSTPRVLFPVPAAAFSPPPKVQSAAVRLDFGLSPPPDGLLGFLSLCFRQPRKTLKNNLRARYGADRLAGDPCAGLRAQQMQIDDLRAMWERLEAAAERRPR